MSSTYSRIECINQNVPEAAIYEQMAEECSELSHALLKKARKLRGENYTPSSTEQIEHDILEEFTDVLLCAKVLHIEMDPFIFVEKLNRWALRVSLTPESYYSFKKLKDRVLDGLS